MRVSVSAYFLSFLPVSLWRSEHSRFFLSFRRVCSFTLTSILWYHCSYLICCFIVIYAKLDERKGGLGGSNIRKKLNGSPKRTRRRILWLPLPPPFDVSCELNCKVHTAAAAAAGLTFLLCVFVLETKIQRALYTYICLYVYTCTHWIVLCLSLCFVWWRRREEEEARREEKLQAQWEYRFVYIKHIH